MASCRNDSIQRPLPLTSRGGFAKLSQIAPEIASPTMNLDLTRRTLLHAAGVTSLAAAAAGAAAAEGNLKGGGPTFASRTPMRVGMVTLRVQRLEPMTDYYRDVLGLSVMERTTTGAVLGAGGV